MAKGLVPIAVRLNLSYAQRAALMVLADAAEQTEDGRFIAHMTLRELAAILATTESGARKATDALRNYTTYLCRIEGTQSAWVVSLPSVDAVNAVVRRNFVDLGGDPEHAPTISGRWRVRRENGRVPCLDVPKKPRQTGRFSPTETVPKRAVSDAQNRPFLSTKPRQTARFSEAPYIGVNTQHANSGVGPASNSRTNDEPGRDASARGRLAEKDSPDASQQTVAVVPDVGGMLG